MKLNNNDDSHNSGLNLLIYNMLLDIESHPAWVCGLKRGGGECGLWSGQSHPAWVCGLKLSLSICYLYLHSHTLRGCVDWNRTSSPRCILLNVTPCVGVWIETSKATYKVIALSKSHPAWVCGLKLAWTGTTDRFPNVTPCVGVWIETSLPLPTSPIWQSHPAWVCGLKPSWEAARAARPVTPCVGVWIETENN